MTISTKFDLHQEVWFMEDNKVVSDEIADIKAITFRRQPYMDPEVCIEYLLKNPGRQNCLWNEADNLLYPSKAELLASL